MKKLVIVAHPNYDHSKVTKGIVEQIKNESKNTDIHVLDSNGVFDIKKEQDLLLNYDVITFAFPVWWYSAPWTLKKYFDEVMQAGFAYSFRGQINDFKLRGKKFSLIVSVGNVETTYRKGGSNIYPIEEYMTSIEGLAHLISTANTIFSDQKFKQEDYWIKPIISWGGAVHGGEIEKCAREYLERIDHD